MFEIQWTWNKLIDREEIIVNYKISKSNREIIPSNVDTIFVYPFNST